MPELARFLGIVIGMFYREHGVARYEAWDAYTANSGTYQVTGSTLTTRPLVAKNPGVMTGPSATREFRIAGNTLTLIQKSAAGQPVSETTTRLTRVE